MCLCFTWHRLQWKSQSSAGKTSAKSQRKAISKGVWRQRIGWPHFLVFLSLSHLILMSVTPTCLFLLSLSSSSSSFSSSPLPVFSGAQQSCNPLTFGSFTFALHFAVSCLPEQRQTSGLSLLRSCRSCWWAFNKTQKSIRIHYYRQS